MLCFEKESYSSIAENSLMVRSVNRICQPSEERRIFCILDRRFLLGKEGFQEETTYCLVAWYRDSLRFREESRLRLLSSS